MKLADNIKAKARAGLLPGIHRVGQSSGLNWIFTGLCFLGLNTNTSPQFNNSGINNLAILEVPGEINFTLDNYTLRLFGDFAHNFAGRERAR